jgi:hypothetical protein
MAASMAHDTLLQTLLGLGIVGATVVFIQAVSVIRSLLRVTDSYLRDMLALMIVPVFINNLRC